MRALPAFFESKIPSLRAVVSRSNPWVHQHGVDYLAPRNDDAYDIFTNNKHLKKEKSCQDTNAFYSNYQVKH
jgi:hypothetical protein